MCEVQTNTVINEKHYNTRLDIQTPVSPKDHRLVDVE